MNISSEIREIIMNRTFRMKVVIMNISLIKRGIITNISWKISEIIMNITFKMKGIIMNISSEKGKHENCIAKRRR